MEETKMVFANNSQIENLQSQITDGKIGGGISL